MEYLKVKNPPKFDKHARAKEIALALFGGAVWAIIAVALCIVF